jgi:uncharacterized protein involved in cysteine biosynthesis
MIIAPSDLPRPSVRKGARALTRAIPYLFHHPKLFKYIIPIFLINGTLIVLLSIGLWAVQGIAENWLEVQSTMQPTGWLHEVWIWIAYVLAGGFLIIKIFLLILYFIFLVPPLFSVLLNLNPLTAWFTCKINGWVFQNELGNPLPGKVEGGGISVGASVGTEIRKFILFYLLLILVMILSAIIPVFGPILSVVIGIWLSVHFTGWGLLTSYFESLGYAYREQRLAMRRQFPIAWGLGGMNQLFMLIPVINILTIFVGAIAGALVASEIERTRLGMNHITDDLK